MPSQNKIFCIHASDASQHFGKMQEIASRFTTEGRIAEFVPLSVDEVEHSLPAKVQSDDLIVILLTNGLDAKLKGLREYLMLLQRNTSGIRIAEVIIDNIPYEREFMNLPINDDKPVRDRQDMDQVWLNIEKNLEALFPKSTSFAWKKVLIPAAAILVVGLLVWLVPKMFGADPEPDFNFVVRDINNGRRLSDSSACYAPCLVSLTSTSRNADSAIWTINDTVTLEGTSTDYPLLQAGKHNIVLTAVKGDKKKPLAKTFLVKATPNFEATNDGCVAPCEIKFAHTLENVKSFAWDFGDGTTSDDATPSKQYQTPAVYKVMLTVTYEDDLKKSASKTVTTRQETTPFAQFTIIKGGVLGQVPRDVTFQNTSQNADQYIWNFGDGTNGITNAGSPNITHKYTTEGSYTVVLTAKHNNKESTVANAFYIGPLEKMVRWPFKDISVLKKIDESPAIKARVMKEYRPQP
jgi:PKD repeat protein